MRFVSVMLALFIAILVAQGLYYRSKTSAALAKAVSALPHDPQAGYAALKPVLGYSNFTSLGAVSAARDEFFNKLRDRAIEGVRKPDPDPLAFAHLQQALGVLAEAGKTPGLQLRGHATALLSAVRENEPQYRKLGTLAAWDAMIASLDRAHAAGAVPSDADFEAWIASLKRADRWQIGLREARENAARQMAAAAAALGKAPPASAADPAAALLDRPMTDPEAMALDQIFGAGLQFTDHLRIMFQLKEYPPELAALRAKFELNLTAVRFAHLAHLRASGGGMVSGYIAKTVINPHADTLPSEGETLGTFMNAVTAGVKQAEELQQVPSFTAEENLLFRLLALRLGAGYWNLIGDPTQAARSAAQYQTLRSAALATPAAAATVRVLDSGPSPAVFIR